VLIALALPTTLAARSGGYTLREATAADVDALMELLADDGISASRGDVAQPEDRPAYLASLEEILAEPSNTVLVVVDADGAIVGTLQLTRVPVMARRGVPRLLVESVRVSSRLRSSGIGSAVMDWVADVAAPALGAGIVQLTSDMKRVDAHRFYERLGYDRSHFGFKKQVG